MRAAVSKTITRPSFGDLSPSLTLNVNPLNPAANSGSQGNPNLKPIRGTSWQESQPGDREVRRQLRLVLKNNGLPPQGELYDRAYAYIREHY